ncbi:hypothetical protein ACFVOR_16415 [Streptomyces sp. NPDC057837]|uniref:hypothetical protein n=1 Tax=Streptomyces sp. NPDC057837 TaxID=3346260 RepID=UPI0036B96CB4
MGHTPQVTSTRPRVRIEIDLNARDSQGRVPAYLADADGHMEAGDVVTAFESEDGVAAPAVVAEVAHGVAYLNVDWDELTDDTPLPVAKPITVQAAGQSIATSSGASWVPVKIKKVVKPLLATAAAVAAATGAGILPQPPSTTAPNSVSMRDATPMTEAGDLT